MESGESLKEAPNAVQDPAPVTVTTKTTTA